MVTGIGNGYLDSKDELWTNKPYCTCDYLYLSKHYGGKRRTGSIPLVWYEKGMHGRNIYKDGRYSLRDIGVHGECGKPDKGAYLYLWDANCSICKKKFSSPYEDICQKCHVQLRETGRINPNIKWKGWFLLSEELKKDQLFIDIYNKVRKLPTKNMKRRGL